MTIARPLRLIPIAVPKVWGGSSLRGLVAEGDAADWPPEDTPIGEAWLVCDRDERASVVADGPFAGRTLRGLMLSEEEALLGSARLSADGSFPLLLKLLEARQNLSVQVHPDAKAAEALGSTPKDECWYVLDAEPGAEVLLGFTRDGGGAEFARECSTSAVVDRLERFTVSAGTAVDVPAGTVHSIGAGIALAEVQNNSNTTYRIFDWDRPGLDGNMREMHLDEALRSIDYGARPRTPGPLEFEDLSSNRRATIHSSDLFRAEVLEVHEAVEMSGGGRPVALFVLGGSGRLDVGDGEDYLLAKGTTWLLPADTPPARILDASGDLRLLRATPG
ncbi:MAG: type I phosphomannose isomerase catalytic subunit [Planctomycetota bacterium]